MKPYHDIIENTIIEILFKNKQEFSGKLKEKLDESLVRNGYKRTASDTYWSRLRRLTAESSKNKQQEQQSKYVIKPILTRNEIISEGNLRGAKVSYSLTRHARTRCDLHLPILKSDALIEKAYSILFRYLAFENSTYRKLEDKNVYYTFLHKLGISKNELELYE